MNKITIITGEYNRAVVATENIESSAVNQLQALLDTDIFENSKIRVMPDVHAGSGCVIGFTATMTKRIVPNVVGVDIGCGMLTTRLGKGYINLAKLDEFITNEIPSGFSCRNHEPEYSDSFSETIKKVANKLGLDDLRPRVQLGTLGGGNHFIEISKDEDGVKYLIIHSGSRGFGHAMAMYYQNKAIKYVKTLKGQLKDLKNQQVGKLKQLHFFNLIQETIDLFKEPIKCLELPKELCFLEGDLMEEYLSDAQVAQAYAKLNRKIIADEILKHLNICSSDSFDTIHNYIDVEDRIIRKGAIKATNGEKVLIPMNMAYGSLLCIGKGNEFWNNSAPHGAGRLLSRMKAKDNLSLDQYKEQMKGVYSSSVLDSTLDEAPNAYKLPQDVIDDMSEMVTIKHHLKPIYNFKAH